MFKNTASQKIALFAFDTTTGAPKTGDAANITAYVNKDWAGANALGDTSATEIDSTNAKGWYLFDLTQSETNANALLFTGKSSTANISVVGQLVFTVPPNFPALGIESDGMAHADLKEWLGTAPASLLNSGGTQLVKVAINAADSNSVDGQRFAALLNAQIEDLIVDNSGFTPTTTQFEVAHAISNTGEADRLKHAMVYAAGQWRRITASTSWTGFSNIKITVSPALTVAPSNGSSVVIFGGAAVNMDAISEDSTAADVLEALMDGALVVQVNGVATATSIPIDGFTSIRNDQFNGRLCTVYSDGSREQTQITDYVHATQTLTVDALSAAPADNVFIVIH